MPRKTTIVKTETEEVPQAASEELAPDNEYYAEDEPDPNSIEAWKNRISQDAIIKVFRRDRFSGKMAYVGSTPPEYFSEEWLQTTHGPGDYQMQAFLNGRYVKGGARTMTIGPLGKEPVEGHPTSNASTATAPAQSSAPDLVAFQLETMREEMRLTREMLMESMKRDGNSTDVPGLLAAVVNLARSMAPPAPVNPLGNIDALLGLLKTGIEIGQTGSVEPKEKGAMGWIKDLAPVVGEVLQGLIPARANGGGAAPAPAGTAVDKPALPAGQADPARAIAMLRSGISYLKTKAVQQKDPGIYVDFVSDNLDDPQWTPLFQLIAKPYDEIAAAIDPDLLNPPYREWFTELFEGIKEVLTRQHPGESDGTVDGPTAGPGGNGDNA